MSFIRLPLLPLALTLTSAMSAASQLMFIGTYTKEGSQGIYAVRLDPATGALGTPALAAATPNPTFLAWHPSKPVLYALGEGPGPDGKISGGAAAFAYEAATGKLSPLNSRGAGGGNTTHLAADASGRMLVTVSYGGGQVASYPLAADGRIGEHASFIAHQGDLGPNRTRQDKPHPHSVTISPDNRFAFVADLGLDRIFRYGLDPAAGVLIAPETFPAPAGAGPRHSKFSADGRRFYVVNELACTTTVYDCDAASGGLALRQTVSTLPAGFTGQNTCAEIRVHPNGKFVYASNRGHESIAVFAIQADGTLQLVELTPCGGKHPRNFNLTPDGRWLVCANMNSDNLVSFQVDPATGRLTATGSTVTVPQAVCVLFAP